MITNTFKEISFHEASTLFHQQTVWFDLEIDPASKKFLIGGLLGIVDGQCYITHVQEAELGQLVQILYQAQYVGGHNIVQFDLPWLALYTGTYAAIDYIKKYKAIDTLVLSSLIFPHKPSHALLKIYKAQSQTNQPCDDAHEHTLLRN